MVSVSNIIFVSFRSWYNNLIPWVLTFFYSLPPRISCLSGPLWRGKGIGVLLVLYADVKRRKQSEKLLQPGDLSSSFTAVWFSVCCCSCCCYFLFLINILLYFHFFPLGARTLHSYSTSHSETLILTGTSECYHYSNNNKMKQNKTGALWTSF